MSTRKAPSRMGMTFAQLADDLLQTRVLDEVDQGHTLSRDLQDHMRRCIALSCMDDWEERTYCVRCSQGPGERGTGMKDPWTLLAQVRRAVSVELCSSIHPNRLDVLEAEGGVALSLRGTGMVFLVRATLSECRLPDAVLRRCRVAGSWVDQRTVCLSNIFACTEMEDALERSLLALEPYAGTKIISPGWMQADVVCREAALHHEAVASLRRVWERACSNKFPRGCSAYVLPLTRLANKGCACILLHMNPEDGGWPVSMRVFLRRTRNGRYEMGFSRCTTYNDKVTGNMHRALIRRMSSAGAKIPLYESYRRRRAGEARQRAACKRARG